MNTLPRNNHFRRKLLPLAVGGMVIAVFTLIGLHAANVRSTLPDPFAPYDPATFGLPEILAGYRIVAVQSADNTPCMTVNQMRLTIQAVDPSPDNPMVARESGDIIFGVKKLYPDIDWSLEYIMPQPVDQAERERFVASMQAWNKVGCLVLGGPRTVTDTPHTKL